MNQGFSGGPPPMPQQAPPTMVYATPSAYLQVPASVAWREGSVLIVPTQATLPDRCAKCNAPVDAGSGGKRITQKLSWHNPAFYLLILAGLLVYVIVALIIQKKAAVSVALCPTHAARRARGLIVAWGSVIVGLAVTIFSCAGAANYAHNDDMWPVFLILGGIVLALVGGVIGMMMARVFTAQKIDDRFAWLKGAGVEFLSNFPDVPRP